MNGLPAASARGHASRDGRRSTFSTPRLPRLWDLVPDGRIIIVSGFDLARSEELLRSGADGHLIKDTPL